MNFLQTFDAILIGGGPAGSCASALLAGDGHRVLVLIPKMKASHFPKKQRDRRAIVAGATVAISPYFIRSKVFWSRSRSLASPTLARLLSIHFFSSVFFVGRSDSKKTPKRPGKGRPASL